MASKSRAREKERPKRVILPLALSIDMMSPAATCAGPRTDVRRSAHEDGDDIMWLSGAEYPNMPTMLHFNFACLHLLFCECLNHFAAQVVDGLHLCRLQRQLALQCTSTDSPPLLSS